MVSVAAKMSLFTTMALAATSYSIGAQLSDQIAALEAAITDLETKHGLLNTAIGDFTKDAEDMLDQQITGDYFVSNDYELVVTH